MDSINEAAFVLLAAGLKRIAPEELAALSEAAKGKTWPGVLVEGGWLAQEEIRPLEALAREAWRLSRRDLRAMADLVGAGTVCDVLYPNLTPAPPGELHLTTPMMNDSMEGELLTPGELLDEYPGRYTMISQQGAGGMGRVYLVHDITTGRDVALKELLRDDDEEEVGPETPVRETTRLAARFLQEARVTAKLEHPAIVPVYELGRRANGQLYYTMRLVKGLTLDQAIQARKTLADRLALIANFRDLCYAIAFAHSRGVIHRDIKPANIMTGEFGETVVLDWGIAKIRRAEDLFAGALHRVPEEIAYDEQAWLRTELGEAVGTPQYMAPEQARGEIEAVDERSDVYALGVVLYQIISGESPFRAPKLQEILRRVWQGEYAPLESVTPEAPPELVSIARKAMALEPENRYPSARALAEDIERWQAGLLVQAYEYRFRELARRYYQRNRTLVHTAAISFATIAVVTAAAFINVMAARQEESRQRAVAEREAYLAQIRLAERHILDHNFGAAKPILAMTRPHLRGWEWSYLAAACAQDLRTIEAASDGIFTAAYVPGSENLFTAASDGRAATWNPETGERLREWNFGAGRIRGSHLAHDGAVAYIALADSTVRRVNLTHGGEAVAYTGHTAPVNDVAVADDGRRALSGGADGALLVWDAQTGETTARLDTQPAEIRTVQIDPAGARAATWPEGQPVRLWNLDSNREIAHYPGVRPRFSPDGALLALAGEEALLINAEDGAVRHRLDTHSAPVTRTEFSPSGEKLITAAASGNVQVWGTASGALLASFNLGAPPWNVMISPDEALLAAYAVTGPVRVWRMDDGALLMEGAGHERGKTAGAFSPDGRHVATASYDGTVKIWDALRPTRFRLAGGEVAAQGARMDSRGDRIISLHTDGSIRVTRAANGEEQLVWTVHDVGRGFEAAFTHDGALAVMAPDQFTTLVADATTGEVRAQLAHGQSGQVLALATHPSRDIVAAGHWDESVVVFDVHDGEILTRLTGANDAPYAVAFHPEGALIAAATHDGEVLVWDWARDQLRHRFQQKGTLTSLAFHPEGRLLLAGGYVREAWLWNLEDGQPAGYLTAHGDNVGAGAFNRAGTRVTSLGWDRAAGLWDTAQGELLVRLPTEGHRVFHAGFALGERAIVTVDDARSGHGIRVWEGLSAADGTAVDLHTLDETLHAYRLRRAESAPENPRPMKHFPITSDRAAQAALLRLMEHAPRLAEDPAILPGAMAHDLGPLGLRPPMEFAGLDGVDVSDAAGIQRLCGERTTQPLAGARLVIQARKADHGLELHPIILHARDERDERPIAREEALRAFAALEDFFGPGNQSLDQVNRRFWDQLTAGAPGERPRVRGVWLNSPHSREGQAPFIALGLAPGDHLTQVAGQFVHDRRTLLMALQAARRRVEEAEGPVEFTAVVRRGILRERTIALRIEP